MSQDNPRRGAKRPTQSDVARRANVSRAAVSIVLRGGNGGSISISQETRKRILDAARELGYTPNLAAQALAGGSNRLIGVFTYERFFPYEADNSYYPYLLGVERQASEEDYNILLFTRRRGGVRPSVYRDGANVLSLVDGSILLGDSPDREELRRIADEGRPFVFIGRREVEGYSIDWVSNDNFQAGHDATRHLIQYGHKRMGFVVGEPLRRESDVDRYAGCEAAVAEVGGTSVVRLSTSLLKHRDELVAAIRAAGITALIFPEYSGMKKCLKVLGSSVRIPRDLSVLALNDGRIAQSDDGPLKPTMVRVHRQQVGEAAVKLLVAKLNGSISGPRQIRIAGSFVKGETTGPAPERPFGE